MQQSTDILHITQFQSLLEEKNTLELGKEVTKLTANKTSFFEVNILHIQSLFQFF